MRQAGRSMGKGHAYRSTQLPNRINIGRCLMASTWVQSEAGLVSWTAGGEAPGAQPGTSPDQGERPREDNREPANQAHSSS
eukprot:gene14550-20591_t